MTPRLASAPCTWGVWERTVDRDDLIPPDLMLRTVQGLGYTGIELGPPGYLGTDPDAVLATLAPYGLELVGAFAPIRIADEDGFREDLDFVDRTVAVLAATGARGPIVLAADENEERLRVAGRPEARAATSLTGDRLKAAAASSRLRSAPAQPASPRRSIRTRRPTSKAPRRSRRSWTPRTQGSCTSRSTPAIASSAAATRLPSCSSPATASRIST